MDVVEFWIVVSAIGASVSGWNLIDAYRDLHALGDIQNGRRLIARSQVRREAIRTAVQAVWFVAGLFAHYQFATTTIVLLLVLTNVAIASGSVLDGIDRRRLRRLLDGKD